MWDIIFYEKEDGTVPVQNFLDELPFQKDTDDTKERDFRGSKLSGKP
jgi:hypothetical protein